MDRAEKQAFIEALSGELVGAGVVIVTHYAGLDVATIGVLRRRMREAGATFRVTKNRLTRLALQGTPYAGIADLFTGPTAIAFSDDVVAPARVAIEFAKEHEHLVVLGGAMGETRLDAAGVAALAELPSLDEMRARLVALMQAPAQQLVRLTREPAARLARVLEAYGRTAGDRGVPPEPNETA